MTTRRDIAKAAIEAIWTAKEEGLLYADQVVLADEIGVASPATVGNALTAFGDDVCQELHPGYTVVYSQAEGYDIVDRLGVSQLRAVTGKVRCAQTKNRVAAAKLKARRNPGALKDVSVELKENELHLERLVGRIQKVTTAQERREARRAGREPG